MSDVIERLNAALEGRYRIERELGEGGMATVYLARDLKHNRNVALKVLKPELAAVVGAERFLAEIETTANLQHPHILPLFDSGEADSFLFYVMPYVEGESLRERLDREHQLPVDEAVSIATKVAGALQAAHEQGVIHRDIKPANILLAKGEPLVADFGIALAVSAGDAGRLTETGLSLGTPHYMSPEQATGDLSVGAATDIYALGCVLYETLVGEPPYTGSTPQAVLGKIVTGDADPVTKHRHSVPANVDAAVRKALEKVPADRFGSATDFARALADMSFRHGDAVGAFATTRATWQTSTLGAVVGAAVVGVVGVLVLSGREQSAPRPVRFPLLSPSMEGVRPASDFFALSPDGRQVVFHGVGGGVSRLYRRALDDPEIHPIAGTEGAAARVTFSPDGRSIAFWTPAGTVERLPLEGGATVDMTEAATEPAGMSWSSGSGLVMGMLMGDPVTGLSLVSTDSGTGRLITDPGGDSPDLMDHNPYALQGTDEVLFVRRLGPGDFRLARVSVHDGTTELFEIPGSVPKMTRAIVGVADGTLLYIDVSGTLMAVAWDEGNLRPLGAPVPVPGVPDGLQYAQVARDGTLAMLVGADVYDAVIVDDRGNTEAVIPLDSVPRLYPRFSPDGHMAALGGLDELWTYEAGIGPRQLGLGVSPQVVMWTADGLQILAAMGTAAQNATPRSNTPGASAGQRTVVTRPGMGERVRFVRQSMIWSRAADASNEPDVFVELPGLSIASVDLSPDGRTLAVAEYSGGIGGVLQDIWTVPVDDLSDPAPFATDPASEAAPRFSPNGQWLAYASNETGPYEVYVRPFPGPGPRIQVSDGGGGQPVWASDGRRLFYRTEDAVMAANLSVDPATRRLNILSTERLFSGDFFGGPESSIATFDVHPDGQHFLLARRSRGSGVEIVIWMSWMDELKQRLAGASP